MVRDVASGLGVGVGTVVLEVLFEELGQMSYAVERRLEIVGDDVGEGLQLAIAARELFVDEAQAGAFAVQSIADA